VINISGTKFEKHCFNISRDIIYSVFYNFSCKSYVIITFPICTIQKHQYLYNKKYIFQKGKHHSYFFEKPFKQAAITGIFHFIAILKEVSPSSKTY